MRGRRRRAASTRPDKPGSVREIPNPTGDCRAPDRGERTGYLASSEETVWLPDCRNPLAREYYRVYARSAELAGTIPRIEEHPLLVSEVCGKGHPRRALVDRYLLCDVGTDRTIPVINSMRPADALALTHFLHERLRFTVTSVPFGDRTLVQLSPPAFQDDLRDACALHPEQNSGALADECKRLVAVFASGRGYGSYTSMAVAAELAALLHELYGVR